MNDYQKSIDWLHRTKFVQGISYIRLIQILLSACIQLFLSFLWTPPSNLQITTNLSSFHRHLRIYRLLNGRYCLPCLLYQYFKWPLQQKKKRKEEAYPWKTSTGSRHTTQIKQSILRLLISVLHSKNDFPAKIQIERFQLDA